MVCPITADRGERETMTVKEFDRITTSTVFYDVFDKKNDLVQCFTRDVTQDPDLYRINMIKLDKYATARVIHVTCINNAICVAAVIDPGDDQL